MIDALSQKTRGALLQEPEGRSLATLGATVTPTNQKGLEKQKKTWTDWVSIVCRLGRTQLAWATTVIIEYVLMQKERIRQQSCF